MARPLVVKINMLDASLPLPEWGNIADAGLDLRSSVNMVIPAGTRGVIPTGITTEFPPQFVAIIKDRSGHAALGRYTHAGVIDSGYRGEWKILVSVHDGIDWNINKGDRVAQVVFLSCFHLAVSNAAIAGSERADKGFGSSGVQ